MYLKRLELQGFKSFAPATSFEFGAGVTCVVGPNGSGKTNVAEAVRWVLGEHASRTLRVRKTEDVIFSGSDKRSPLGLAEVRLILDNSDGWLPMDFAEVVVSRRAYRSGENEYYINQSRVRLRDVTELFLKAQIGQNSYAFMGQGLVEEVLTLRPEDRRGLIEEAADVRLHRTKLDQARNRLAATRDNLERVALLVKEIEPRLRQLERQANRAANYERLSNELAEALQVLFGQQWQEAQELLTLARATGDQRQEEADRTRRAVEACEEGLSSLVAAIDERRRDIAERETAHRALEDYQRDLQRRVTLDEERQAMMTSRRNELMGEIERLRREKAELESAIAQHEERGRQLHEQLAAARPPEEEVEEAERAEARLEELRETLSETETKATQARARRAEVEALVSARSEQRQRLEAEVASIEHDISEQRASMKTWALEFAARRRRYAQLAPELQESSRALDEIDSRLNDATLAVARRQEEIRILTVEIESAETRLEAAQASETELPAPDAGMRALLAAGGRIPGEETPADGRIHGMIGVAGQLLRVPAGLERAIEAALAENLHAVIVETQEDALAAIELLLSEDLGRATIVPLGDLQGAHPLNLLEERGVLGVASELVQYDNRYRPLIYALLGRTIVVENLGTAKKVLRRGMGSVVTLDGTLLRPLGSATAGSAKAVRRAFAHQREVGELPQELDRLRAAHRDATQALEDAQRDLAAAQRDHEEQQPQVERLRAEMAAAEEALRQHRARLPSAAARLSALHARHEEARKGLSEIERTLATSQLDVERAQNDIDQHDTALAGIRTEVEELAAAREAVMQENAERSTRLVALEAEQQALTQLLEGQASTLARASRELTHREELIAKLSEELTTLEGRLGAARQELEEKAAAAATSKEQLQPARNALEQLDSRHRTINDELTAARSAALAAERAQLDAEADIRLRTEELDALRERLKEEGFSPTADGEILPDEPEEQAEPPPDADGEPMADEKGEGPPAWLTTETASSSEELPPMRGGAQADPVALKERISEIRSEIRRLGPVNEQAETDFAESRERYDFLTAQLEDLSEAEASLMEAIEELERIIKTRFSSTFQQVNTQFQHYFQTFFGGGQAELVLTRTDEEKLPGVDIQAQPPRKKVRTLNMLSGGERSLTAVALLFALLHIHPSPICVLDEVDAALDESNVGRFANSLRELAERTQFIIITHNRRTIEVADTIYGVSMGEDSTSSVLSLRLSDIKED